MILVLHEGNIGEMDKPVHTLKAKNYTIFVNENMFLISSGIIADSSRFDIHNVVKYNYLDEKKQELQIFCKVECEDHLKINAHNCNKTFHETPMSQIL
jgi:L-rhamnose mutarotase